MVDDGINLMSAEDRRDLQIAHEVVRQLLATTPRKTMDKLIRHAKVKFPEPEGVEADVAATTD